MLTIDLYTTGATSQLKCLHINKGPEKGGS